MRIVRQRPERLGEVEVVYRQQLPAFRRVAAAVSGDRDAAPDIVQESFVRAVRDLASFRGDGPLEAWLCRIVVNTARNHRRAFRPHDDLADDAGVEVNGAPESTPASVAVALAGLPERQRLALFLRYYADLDYEAIATAMEISSGTVGATLNAARESLQRRLSGMEAKR